MGHRSLQEPDMKSYSDLKSTQIEPYVYALLPLFHMVLCIRERGLYQIRSF